MEIGFIGLGLMGSAMCNRLLDLGYELSVIANRSRANVDKLVARGAQELGTARELAAASDVVMLCVDTSASVESRIYGEDGVLAGVQSDAAAEGECEVRGGEECAAVERQVGGGRGAGYGAEVGIGADVEGAIVDVGRAGVGAGA